MRNGKREAQMRTNGKREAQMRANVETRNGKRECTSGPPYIIVHVENVVSLFSSPSTSSQKVQKRAAIYSGQLVLLVNFYHCFSGVAQVCRDAAGK